MCDNQNYVQTLPLPGREGEGVLDRVATEQEAKHFT